MQRKLNGPPPTEVSETSVLPSEPDEPTVKSAEEMIKTGLTALATARSMQTRRLAIVQDDPNVTKVVKLAQILREIYAQVTSVNGKKERCLHSSSGAWMSTALPVFDVFLFLGAIAKCSLHTLITLVC